MAIHKIRRLTIDMNCVDTIARYLFYTFVIDFSLEMLDLIHRIYEADECVPQPRFHGAQPVVVSQFSCRSSPARWCLWCCWV